MKKNLKIRFLKLKLNDLGEIFAFKKKRLLQNSFLLIKNNKI